VSTDKGPEILAVGVFRPFLMAAGVFRRNSSETVRDHVPALKNRRIR
jgi:hypothetical protein